MIRTDKLRGIMVERGYTQKMMADKCGVSTKTFGEHLRKGVFGSDEIQIMIDTLDISDPMSIFFAHE